MKESQTVWFVVATLATIGSVAAGIAFGAQTYFGRSLPMILLGPVLAAIGGIGFALWLVNRH